MGEIDVQRCVAAAQRGIDWIVRSQREDGSFCDREEGIGSYYKTPYALALAGRPREAQRLLDWVAKHHFTADGDFRTSERKAREPPHEAWPAYGNAWLIQGAHRLGRFDLSLPGADFLLRAQATSGGFCAWDGPIRYLEPVCTSWGGLAALTTGHGTAAQRAGGLLANLVLAQPEPGRFYFRMNLDGQVVTGVPSGRELFYFVDASRPKQIYFHPGIALIFLTRLHRATRETRYLDACKEIFRFTEHCADDVYCFPPSGKLGLGCALLYAITGIPAARSAALRVAAYLVETQTDGGFWKLPDEELYASIPDKDSFEVRLDLCSEFSTFLLEIASYV